MKIDPKQIDKVSKLALLTLTDDEKERYSHQLSDIIEYVEKLNNLDLDSVEATDHIADLFNVFREDQIKPSIGIEALKNIAPQFKDDHVVVPKIINADN